MKTGKTLQELAAEIERQRLSKRDFVAGTAGMMMLPVEHEVVAAPLKNKANSVEMQLIDRSNDRLVWQGGIRDLAHGQISEHVKIDKRYYDRMRNEGEFELLANNVNRWFQKYPADRMVRTLDDGVRGFLSSSYRPLEHFDLATAVLPVLSDRNLIVESCELTERRIYIKAIDEKLYRDVPI